MARKPKSPEKASKHVKSGVKSPRKAKRKRETRARKKLSREFIDRVCNLIRGGNYPKRAALVAGVSEGGFYKWTAKGRADLEKGLDNLHTQLVEEVERAVAEAEALHVANLFNAGKSDWRASAEWLRRARHADWGDRSHVEQRNVDRDGNDVEPVTGVLVVPAKTSIEDWIAEHGGTEVT